MKIPTEDYLCSIIEDKGIAEVLLYLQANTLCTKPDLLKIRNFKKYLMSKLGCHWDSFRRSKRRLETMIMDSSLLKERWLSLVEWDSWFVRPHMILKSLKVVLVSTTIYLWRVKHNTTKTTNEFWVSTIWYRRRKKILKSKVTLSKLWNPNIFNRGHLKRKSKRMTISEEWICRVCLDSQVEPDNFLISPCKCAGSMKNIHIKCLQEWLESKKTVNSGYYTCSYCWPNFECELCKF
jgi:hypothetical protein